MDVALEKLGGTLTLDGCAWAAGHTGRPPPGRILLVTSAASEAGPFDDDNHQVAGLVVGGTAVVFHAWSGISGNDYRRHCMRQWRELLEQKQTAASEAYWTPPTLCPETADDGPGDDPGGNASHGRARGVRRGQRIEPDGADAHPSSSSAFMDGKIVGSVRVEGLTEWNARTDPHVARLVESVHVTRRLISETSLDTVALDSTASFVFDSLPEGTHEVCVADPTETFIIERGPCTRASIVASIWVKEPTTASHSPPATSARTR